jgi:hypothetical protein
MILSRLLVLTVCASLPTTLSISATPQVNENNDLNVGLMKTTFRIEGWDSEGKAYVGTVFFLGRPLPNKERTLKVLIATADHVFKNMQGEFAKIVLRRQDANATWRQYPVEIRIRDGARPLWTRSPEADVAVAYVALPPGVLDSVVPVSLLADDETLKKYGITAGAELRCLGYPYGIWSSEAGFPILRVGAVASYPLLPTAETKSFLFDFRVFGGNSDGPVYFVQPPVVGAVTLNSGVQFIVGLVTDQEFEKPGQTNPLSVARVVDASLIKQTIDMLPPPDDPRALGKALQMTPIAQAP